MTRLTALSILLLLFLPHAAHAWGPATHIYFAHHALEVLAFLGAPLAGSLLRHRTAFLFGSFAADMTIGKSFAADDVHCHNWSVAFGLLEAAGNERQRAFMWGYLCHLAADTVAHNHFVPDHMAGHGDRRAPAHAYLEVRADHLVGEPYWRLLTEVRRLDHRESERLLSDGLVPTLFSHRVNRRLFHGMMGVVCRRSWRQAVERVAVQSSLQITPESLEPYHRAALIHTLDLLRYGSRAGCVRHLDPTGSEALARARRGRSRHLPELQAVTERGRSSYSITAP